MTAFQGQGNYELKLISGLVIEVWEPLNNLGTKTFCFPCLSLFLLQLPVKETFLWSDSLDNFDLYSHWLGTTWQHLSVNL